MILDPLTGILAAIGFLFVALYIQKAISKHNIIGRFKDEIADLRRRLNK